MAAALVVAEGVLAGIITERDVSKRVVAEGKNPDDVSVADIMTADPITLQVDDPICHAFHRMGTFRDYRHIPLVEANGKPVGIVSIRDLVDFTVEMFPEHLANVPPDPHPSDPTRFGG
ncbi:MAG: CBS domain-containing protein [Planctomycetota bacterium]